MLSGRMLYKAAFAVSASHSSTNVLFSSLHVRLRVWSDMAVALKLHVKSLPQQAQGAYPTPYRVGAYGGVSALYFLSVHFLYLFLLLASHTAARQVRP